MDPRLAIAFVILALVFAAIWLATRALSRRFDPVEDDPHQIPEGDCFPVSAATKLHAPSDATRRSARS